MRKRGKKAVSIVRRITALALLVAIFVACLPGSMPIALSQPAMPQPISSDRNVALVIGNGRFDAPFALTQPAADADAIAARLRARGFKLVTASGSGCGEDQPLIDLDRSTMRAAIACFAKAAEGARQAVFYFSGHTIILDDRNYLVPAGTALASNPSSDGLVEVGLVLDALDQAKAGLSVMVLDAARAAIKDISADKPGLNRVAATARPRVVAYSAPVTAWTAEGAAAEGRSRRTRPAEPATDKANNDAADAANARLSAYTRRLVRALDDDLDLRSLDQPGHGATAIFVTASQVSGRPSAEVTIENVTTNDMLGQLPKIGKSTCDLMTWRAENLGNCIEIAAAYENCGKAAAMRQRLQNMCAADFSTLVRYTLQASLAGVMKTKSCAGFKEFIAKFESEPSTAELKEFKEIRSLAQYTCALEAKEQVKTRFATVMSERDCQQTHRLLADGRDILEADMRGKLEKLSKEVCCPEYRLGKDCITRNALSSRVVAALEKKGCVTGRTAQAKAARAASLVAKINAENSRRVELAMNGALVDQIWSRVEALKKDDCLCQKPAADACVSEAPSPTSLAQTAPPPPVPVAAAPPAPLPQQAPPPASPPQIALAPAPQKQIAPAATANVSLANFAITDNRDIHGQDIPLADGTVGVDSADIGACVEQCQSNRSCVAVSFDRWKNRCYLKQSLAPSVLEPRSTIAVKKPLQPPIASTSRIDVQVARNVRFNGDNARRRRAADFNACRSACTDDARCVAFSFLKNVRNADNCETFQLTGGYVRDVATDSGFKHQQP